MLRPLLGLVLLTLATGPAAALAPLPVTAFPEDAEAAYGLTLAEGGLYFVAQATAGAPWSVYRMDLSSYEVAEVASSSGWSGGSQPTWLVPFGDQVLFDASTSTAGRELWIAGPGAGSGVQLADLNTGSADGVFADSPAVVFDGKAYFRGSDDGAAGVELFESDGTPSGTTLAQDIRPGPQSGDPSGLTVAGDFLLFTASHDDAAGNREPCAFDGSAVTLLADIRGDQDSGPHTFTPMTGSGGAAGVIALFDAVDNGGESWLYATDGLTATPVTTFDPVTTGAGYEPRSVGDAIVFRGSVGGSGVELWRSDGTALGTAIVKDIMAGATGSGLKDLTDVGSRICFSADGGTGAEPWCTTGTAPGTQQIADVGPGGAGSNPGEFAADGTTLYFAATVAGDRELYISEAPGAAQLLDLHPGASSKPRELVVAGGELFLVADLPEAGAQLTRFCPGCSIDGACVDEGAAHPEDPCRRCDSSTDNVDWSLQPAGTTCGKAGCEVCSAEGACEPKVCDTAETLANPCLKGICTLGECGTQTQLGLCADGAGLCEAGECQCEQSAAATANVCLATGFLDGACVDLPQAQVACDDKNPCTTNDVCVGSAPGDGSCAGTPTPGCDNKADLKIGVPFDRVGTAPLPSAPRIPFDLTNAGPKTAVNARLTLPLRATEEISSALIGGAQALGSECSVSDDALTCAFGDLEVGETLNLDFQYTTFEGLANASVTSDTQDQSPGNNSAAFNAESALFLTGGQAAPAVAREPFSADFELLVGQTEAALLLQGTFASGALLSIEVLSVTGNALATTVEGGCGQSFSNCRVRLGPTLSAGTKVTIRVHAEPCGLLNAGTPQLAALILRASAALDGDGLGFAELSAGPTAVSGDCTPPPPEPTAETEIRALADDLLPATAENQTVLFGLEIDVPDAEDAPVSVEGVTLRTTAIIDGARRAVDYYLAFDGDANVVWEGPSEFGQLVAEPQEQRLALAEPLPLAPGVTQISGIATPHTGVNQILELAGVAPLTPPSVPGAPWPLLALGAALALALTRLSARRALAALALVATLASAGASCDSEPTTRPSVEVEVRATTVHATLADGTSVDLQTDLPVRTITLQTP